MLDNTYYDGEVDGLTEDAFEAIDLPELLYMTQMTQ